MTASTARSTDTRVFRVYIKTTPQKIWDAITTTEWAEKYGYQGGVDYELKKGGRYRGLASKEMRTMGAPETIIDGEVLECDPPRKLVQTWRILWSPEVMAEGFTKVTWDIVDGGNGLCRLTVTHDLTNAPLHALQVDGDKPLEEGGGGWSWILSDIKSLLETGKAMWG